jgi:exosortase/archaeosortase family protein
MNKQNLQSIKSKLNQPKIQSLVYVFYFTILLLSFHYIYKFWAGNLNFYPFAKQVDNLFIHASLLLFNQSIWVLKDVLQIDIIIEGQTIFVNNLQAYVDVSPGCTSLKQWMHWLFIMLLFPGPWKHKLWYIPLGLVFIQFINVFRVVGLALLIIPWPQHFHFFHDYIFKTIFYFGIFMMWVLWVEYFTIPNNKMKSSKILLKH